MAFTQAQLDALEATIATGETKVKYQDKEVQYNSIGEMLALRQMMKDELATTAGTAPDRASRVAFSRQ